MKNTCSISVLLLLFSFASQSQLRWVNVDSAYGTLRSSIHIYRTADPLGGKPNIAYYAEVHLGDKKLEITTDTSHNRRLTPASFYKKNSSPSLVVNCTFFSFATNQNLNIVMRNGRLLGYNVHSIAGRGKDTLTYRHVVGGAFGITKKRKADVAWVYTDSSIGTPYFLDKPVAAKKDSNNIYRIESLRDYLSSNPGGGKLAKWKMRTAIGGGPVLLQDGRVMITNEEELKFAGRAINDRHPRTAIGYTRDNRMIVLAVEGRNPGRAEGATLVQLADMLRELGCVEALNLDGGGSSCLLINGKETIKPSDKEGQRPVPAVLIVKTP